MSATVAIGVLIIFIIGVITGIVVLVSIASHREDKRRRLSIEAPDRTTLAARYLTSLYIKRPGSAPARPESLDDQQAQMLGWPHRGTGEWPG